jgi:hypothetical protein
VTQNMSYHNIYYFLKPFIPRSIQLFVRRRITLRKLQSCRHVWPIEEKAKRPLEGWSGWPNEKKFAFVSTHDVEGPEGVQNCSQLAKLEEKYGLRSSFNFVAEDCEVPAELLHYLESLGFEIGVHGLHHDGNLFRSKKIFGKQAIRINYYLKKWESVGFRTPSMYHNLDWIHNLNIEYDCSTFDTDPFEPQSDGMGTIFPFWVTADGRAATASAISATPGSVGPELQSATCNAQLVTRNPEPITGLHRGYVELPYTLAQDFTLFILMKERNIEIWKKKLDWIAENGGMALLITHPDYMNGEMKKDGIDEYPVKFYKEFLDYLKGEYEGQYWNPLPREMARFWKQKMVTP